MYTYVDGHALNQDKGGSLYWLLCQNYITITCRHHEMMMRDDDDNDALLHGGRVLL